MVGVLGPAILLGIMAFAYLLGRDKKIKLPAEPDENKSWLELEEFLIEVEGMSYKPYMDQAGHLTVGVGHKILPSEMAFLDRQLLPSEVRELLQKDVEKVLPVLDGFQNLSNGQKIALISLAFNIGNTAFKNSTLRKKLLENDKSAVAEFERWVFITNPRTGQKEVNKGLQNRRAKEVKKFNS
jgi:lysozyme